MATAPTRPQTSAPTSVPPLENGDRLTRAEFERRYEAMPQVKKAELIEGVVYMGSPVRAHHHGRPHAHVLAWLVGYETATPGLFVLDNTTVRLDQDNMPQPDALVMIEPARGGQARIGEEDLVEGAPELVVEIAASTVSRDVHDKLRVYRRNGVREYLVWRVLDGAIDWLALDAEGRYEPLAPDATGWLESRILPGLRLDPTALVRGDMGTVLEVLRAGLATPEHGVFCERLRAVGPG